MLSCKETARLLSESLEHPLPFRRRLGLKMHLLMCRFCRRYARQVRAIESVARSYARRVEDPDRPASGSLTQDARERLKAALRKSR